jgi:hypothetical protein
MQPRPTGAGSYDQLLLDALAAGVPAELRALVLLHALRQSDLARLPDDAETFARFALGSLRDAVTARAGSAAADLVIGHLAPVLQAAGSQRRRRESHVTPNQGRSRDGYATPSQGTRAIPAGDVNDDITPTRSSGKPRAGTSAVVVVTGDGPAAQDIARRLGVLARVSTASTIEELRAVLSHEERQQSLLVLVIDGRAPSIAPDGITSLAPALPRGTSVLAWGLDAKYQEALAVVEAGGIRCVRCAAASRPVDISAVLRAMV